MSEKKNDGGLTQKQFDRLAKKIYKNSGPPIIYFPSVAAKKRFLLREKLLEAAMIAECDK